MSGIKSIYGNSFAFVRAKGGEKEQFWIDSGVRQGCIMFPWLFNLYMDGVMKEVKIGTGRKGLSFLEDEREWIDD